MESETPEVRDIKKHLCQLLDLHSEMVHQAHQTVDKDKLRSNISHSQVEGVLDVDAVSVLKASVVSGLQKEVNALPLEDEIIDDELHINFNLLNDLDNESSHKELLIEKTKKELAETRSRINLVNMRLSDIKNIKEARKEKGEMVELKGYSQKQLEELNSKLGNVFASHRQELKFLLDKLFPKHADKMKTLLRELTDVAYSGTGEGYFDLQKFPDMAPAAQLLLQHNIIRRDPNNKKKVCLCIFN